MIPPAYRRISNTLRKKILTGEIPAGFKLPCEKDLAKQYGVSQITIRQALKLLEGHLLLDRTPRRGTVVCRLWPRKTLGISLSDPLGSIHRHAPNLRRQVLSTEWVVPPEWIAETLELPARKKCLFVRYVESMESVPLILAWFCIPRELAGLIDKKMLRCANFLEVWVEREALEISHVQTIIAATIADDEVVKDLRVRPGSPMLLTSDMFYGAGGRPLGISRRFYRADCSKLVAPGNQTTHGSTGSV